MRTGTHARETTHTTRTGHATATTTTTWPQRPEPKKTFEQPTIS